MLTSSKFPFLCAGWLLLFSTFSQANTEEYVPVVVHYIMDEIEPEAAGTITLPDISNTGEYTVSWTLEQPGEYYVLEALTADSGNNHWQQVFSGDATSWSVSQADNGRYKYQVKACDSNGCGNYLESAYVTVELPPSEPSNVIAEQVGNENSVRWTASTLASNSIAKSALKPAAMASTQVAKTAQTQTQTSEIITYLLEQSINGDNYQPLEQTTATSFSHTVTENETRRYRVSACDQDLCSKPSAQSNAVGGFAGTNRFTGSASGNQVNFTWDEVTGATSYLIQVQYNGGEWLIVAFTEELYYLYDLPGEGQYNFRVRACDALTCYEGSAQQYAVTINSSAQCRQFADQFQIYSDNGNYYLVSPDPTPAIEFIPGTLLIPVRKDNELRMGLWQISPLQSPAEHWQLTSISKAEFKQAGAASGGLYMSCQPGESSSAILSYRNVDGSDSFSVQAEMSNGVVPTLTMLDSVVRPSRPVALLEGTTITLNWDSIPENTDLVEIYVSYGGSRWVDVTNSLQRVGSGNEQAVFTDLEEGSRIFKIRACDLNRACTEFSELSNETVIGSAPVVYRDSEGNLYLWFPSRSANAYYKLSEGSNGWQAEYLTAQEWNTLDPVNSFEDSGYQFEFGDFAGNELIDFRIFDDGILNIIIEQKSQILNIRTELMGAPAS
ncbi:hypothetical protein [Thalassomonas sp. RHCl1]|uniref:hypothetical protein n=1 Tax=Thalassomonas sp. RHCl1 TaxID=2995320 RepID=UPI00248BB240|nr:hypothetical protein [Thalassomonas sp. RHCl1]